MAGRTPLKVSRPIRFAAVVALVLLAHSIALRWLQGELDSGEVLKPMANPMFTRLLKPEQPAAVAVTAGPSRAARKKRPAITSVSKAASPKPAASVPRTLAAAS